MIKILGLGLVVILVVVGVQHFRRTSTPLRSENSSAVISTSTLNQEIISSGNQSISIKPLGNETVTRNTYKSSNSKYQVSFTETGYTSRNPLHTILLNGKSVGEVPGYFFTAPSFSPDSSYVAFIAATVGGGASSWNFHLYLINTMAGELKLVGPPPVMQGEVAINQANEWIDDRLKVRAATITNDGSTLNVAQSEQWYLDANTGTYSLAKD